MDSDTLEAATDILESAAETLESVPTTVKTNPVLISVVAILSASMGAAIATYATKKYISTKYETIVEEEVRKARKYYKEYFDPCDISDDSDELVIVEEVVEKEPRLNEARDISETEGYVSYNDIPKKKEDTVVVRKNIFASTSSGDSSLNDYDPAVEEEKREEGRPYIIKKETFFENDEDYSQTTLTYYEADDVLLDEDDRVIDNQIRLLGDDNYYFGRGSGDKNIVYIRNEYLEADYEVVRSLGSYAEEVFGIEEPETPKIRKFRKDD